MPRALLNQLIDVLDHAVVVNHLPLVEVLHITDDSRRVQSGTVFIAIKTERIDGVQFAIQSIARGAIAVVSEDPIPADCNTCWIQVQDAKMARLQLAKQFYGNPFAHLQCHGVTGTNGKTTTAFIMDAVLTSAGYKVALLGTIVQKIADTSVPSQLTTPGLIELYDFASRAVQAGCTHLVMEVSSHSLHQGRVAGIAFESVLFSNLTQDHLDYHHSMDEYFSAKRLLFTHYRQGVAVINVDDAWGHRLVQDIPEALCIRVSRLGNPAEVTTSDAHLGADGIVMTIPALSTQPFQTALVGEFNVDNLLLVAGWSKALNLSESAYRKAVANVRVPGRFELAWNRNERRVIVDYAHTPDALSRVLQTARSLCQGKLHVVFGCGGDRDKGKRPIMGKIAEQIADVCWVTSDNPRTEDAKTIISEIVAGMTSELYVLEDRRVAIKTACKALKAGDWLVVAGKGHEDYQIIGSTKYPFDDRLVVSEAFAS